MSAIDTMKRAGKYLTFSLNGEYYGLDAMRVDAVIGFQDCTPLPQAPSYVRGLTMVRGKVVPVIDPHLRLGMPPAEIGDATCIVLVSVGSSQTGIIVDKIDLVTDITEDQFETDENGINTDHLIGIAKQAEKIISILDIDDVLRF